MGMGMKRGCCVSVEESDDVVAATHTHTHTHLLRRVGLLLRRITWLLWGVSRLLHRLSGLRGIAGLLCHLLKKRKKKEEREIPVRSAIHGVR
jgi:hypothetical protein